MAAAAAMNSARDSALGSAQDTGSKTVSRTVFTEEVDILNLKYGNILRMLIIFNSSFLLLILVF